MRKVWIDVVTLYLILYLALFFFPIEIIPTLKGYKRLPTFLLHVLLRFELMLLAIPAVMSLKNLYHPLLDQLSNWKTTFTVSTCFLGFCVSQLLLFGDKMINHPISIKWRWSAIIIYTTLFMILNYLFQRKKIPPFQSVMLSLFSCQLSGILYEIPRVYSSGILWFINGFLLKANFYMTLLILMIMLTTYKFKWSWKHLFPFTLLLLQWILYYDLPGWSVRLGPWLLLMSMSVTIKPFRRRRK